MPTFDVSHNGITWTLQDEPVDSGVFADGSPWVEPIGQAVVIAITPGPTTATTPVLLQAGARVNGSMKNPTRAQIQGFDERKWIDNLYDPWAFGLRFDKNNYLDLPIDLDPGDALVSSKHYASPPVFSGTICNGPWIEAMGVLTVVGPGHGLTDGSHFRPYYGGPTKFPPRSAESFSVHKLPRVFPAATFPVTGGKVTAMQHLAYVCRGLNSTENQLTPTLWGPSYYRDMLGENAGWGENLLTLCNDAANSTKHDLAIAMCQWGLDLDSAFRNELQRGDLAHGYGRGIPIMLAGFLLNDEDLMDLPTLAHEYPHPQIWGGGNAAEPLHRWFWTELADTYWYNPALQVADWIQPNYQDGGGLTGPVYPAPQQSWFPGYRTHASATLASQIIVARLCGFLKGIAWAPLFAYVDRYIAETSAGGPFESLDESYADGDHYDAYVLARGGVRQCTRGAIEIGSMAGPTLKANAVPTAGQDYTLEVDAPDHPNRIVLIGKSCVPNSTVPANGTALLAQRGYLGSESTGLIFLNPATHQFMLAYIADGDGKVTIPAPHIGEPQGCSYTLQAVVIGANGEWIPTNALEITLQ